MLTQSLSSYQVTHFLRCDRPSGTGRGGVAIYIRDNCHFTQFLPTLVITHPGVETLLVKLEGQLIIAILYRSPAVTEAAFQQSLTQLLRHVPQGYRCIIAGDFNKDLSSNPRCVEFAAFRDDFNQIIEQCTYYVGYGKGSLLDHIYTRDCDVVRSGVLSTYYSDHDPVYAQIAAVRE